MNAITVTQGAQEYLNNLLEDNTNIKLTIDNVGSPRAETVLQYCKEGEEEDFASLDLQGFKLFYNELHEKYLKDTTIDYDTERFGGQLTIKAPNTKTPIIDENSTIEERINAVIINEVNPGLAAHGGMVDLVEFREGKAILKFGGGCQGCGMVDLTLADGVEKLLKERIPEITEVSDMTDHSFTDNAYYNPTNNSY
jgi:Fe/S biogenesis protein NfuA